MGPAFHFLPHGFRFVGLVLDLLLSFGVCLAGGQVFGRRGVVGQGQSEKGVIVSEVETQAAGWGVVPVTESERMGGTISHLVTIVIHPQYQEAGIVVRQVQKVFLRDLTNSRYKYGIASYGRSLSYSSDGSSFLVAGPGGEPSRVGMAEYNAGFLCAPRSQEANHRSPLEFRGYVPAVLKVDNYFCVLSGVLRNDEIGNGSILSANCHIAACGASLDTCTK